MRTLATLMQTVGLVAVVAATASLSPAAGVIVVGVILVALGIALELRAR
jgi:hypothetical protein